MKKEAIVLPGIVCAVALLAAVAMVGCEESATSTGAIIVTPPTVTLTYESNSVTFVAGVDTNSSVEAGEFFVSTLEWSVQTPGLGNIAYAAGDRALYVAANPFQTGVNYVRVKDGYNREGWAVVTQE